MRAVLAIFPLVFVMNCFAVPTLQQRVTCVRDLEHIFPLWADPGFGDIFPVILGSRNFPGNTTFLVPNHSSVHRNRFRLADGIVLAFDNTGEKFEGVSVGGEAGTKIYFLGDHTDESSPPPENDLPKYCAEVTGQAYRHLSIEGDTQGFSLCRSTTANEENIVYRASPNNDGSYLYDTCYSVFLLMFTT